MSEILSERIPLELEGTPVSSIMIEEPFTCTQDCTISDVVRMLAENEVSSMPVIDERNQGSSPTAMSWEPSRSIALTPSSRAATRPCCTSTIRALSSASKT